LLFAGLSFYHMGMGMAVIIEDYIHRRSTLVTLLLLNAFVWFGFGAATIVALLKVALATSVGVAL